MKKTTHVRQMVNVDAEVEIEVGLHEFPQHELLLEVRDRGLWPVEIEELLARAQTIGWTAAVAELRDELIVNGQLPPRITA